jgi:hypothetical protein
MKSVADQPSLPPYHLLKLNLRKLSGLAAIVAAVAVLVALLAHLSGLAGHAVAGAAPSKFDVIDFAGNSTIGVQEARALIASGALVLDARAPARRLAEPIANVLPIDGIDLASDDATLTAGLRAYGVSAAQPVVVVGDPADAASNDAAIVAALRSLGHPRVVRVEGGLPALLAAGFVAIYPPAGGGDFTVAR